MTALAALAPTVRGVPARTVTVADLPSVALDRLRDQAALQTRVDRKYVCLLYTSRCV